MKLNVMIETQRLIIMDLTNGKDLTYKELRTLYTHNFLESRFVKGALMVYIKLQFK